VRARSERRLEQLVLAGSDLRHPDPEAVQAAALTGLSATVRPVETVAEFLRGGRPPGDGGRRVAIVQPPSTKRIQVDVVVPPRRVERRPVSPS